MLFLIGVILFIAGWLLFAVGLTAKMSWENGTGDWWAIFLGVGPLMVFIGSMCCIVRMVEVMW